MPTYLQKDFSKIEQGINDAFELVASTMGPFGGNVSVAGGRERRSFDDGLKALEFHVPDDPELREGVLRVLDAATSQLREVGDGTSTTTILLHALYFAGKKLLGKGYRHRDIISAFKKCAEAIEAELEKMKRSGWREEGGKRVVDRSVVVKAATVAVHGDKVLGDMIGGLIADLGEHGMVTAEMTVERKMSVSRSTGYSWAGGCVDEAFYNVAGAARHGESMVVIVNEVCDNINTDFWKEVFEIWQRQCAAEGKDLGLILVSRGATGGVMSAFARGVWSDKHGNQRKVRMLILTPPGDGNDSDVRMMLGDLAALTGAKVFDKLRGQAANQQVAVSSLGRVLEVSATKKTASLRLMPTIDIGLSEEPVEDIKQSLVADINAFYGQDDVAGEAEMQEQKKKRLAAIESAVGVIKIPSMSETEFNTVRETVEDGFRAAKSSMDGVVPGGGKAIAVAAVNANIGAHIADAETLSAFLEAMCAPANVLWESEGSGVPLEQAGHFVSGGAWQCYDMTTGEVGDGLELGIIDSVEVVKAALRNAMSVAMPLLNTKSHWIVNGVHP